MACTKYFLLLEPFTVQQGYLRRKLVNVYTLLLYNVHVSWVVSVQCERGHILRADKQVSIILSYSKLISSL